jgi:hypothetical protein
VLEVVIAAIVLGIGAQVHGEPLEWLQQRLPELGREVELPSSLAARKGEPITP